ncbi:hypothetical protein ACFLXY_01660 [Chloroflexota bacterium]
MKDEDVIKRLENLTLPDIRPASHHSELRTSLIENYSSLQAGGERNGLLSSLRLCVEQNRRINKVGVLMVSVSLVVMVVIVLALQFTGVFSGVSGVLNKASAAMERVESYRVIGDAYNRSEYTNNEPVELYYYKGEYASSDRYRLIQKVSIFDSEMIVIRKQVYMKGYAATPLTPEQVIESLPNKQLTLDQLNTLVDIKVFEDEYIDGVLCYHYQGYLDVEKYLEKMLPVMEKNYTELYRPFTDSFDERYKDETEKPVLPSLEESVKETLERYEERIRKYETVIDYWIGKEDYLIRKEESIRRPVSDPLEVNEEMITTVKYYDFNEDIIIDPPLTESGELEEGWYELSMENFGRLR